MTDLMRFAELWEFEHNPT